MLWHKKKFNKKLISLACCSLGTVILMGCQSPALVQSTSTSVQPSKQPQRVVFFLGDGITLNQKKLEEWLFKYYCKTIIYIKINNFLNKK